MSAKKSTFQSIACAVHRMMATATSSKILPTSLSPPKGESSIWFPLTAVTADAAYWNLVKAVFERPQSIGSENAGPTFVQTAEKRR